MDLFLAYIAGLLTLLNPCVLPVLPVVLTGAVQAHRLGPVALALGMGISFVSLGLLIYGFGYAIGLDEARVAQIGAALMVGFGLMLLVPRFSTVLSTALAGVSGQADQRMAQMDPVGLRGQFLGGLLLGAVWSPCIGPTLGAAIALASQGGSLIWAGAVMTGFALGVGTLIIALGFGARGLLQRHRGLMRALADKAQPLMGLVFVLVGLAILFRLHHVFEAWAVAALPGWMLDLSVRY